MEGLLVTACCLWVFWGITQSAGLLLRLLVAILKVVVPIILLSTLLVVATVLFALLVMIELVTGRKLSSRSMFEGITQKFRSESSSPSPSARLTTMTTDDDDDDGDIIDKPKRKGKRKASRLEDGAPMSLRDLLGSDGELPPNWEEEAPPRRKPKP